jgi:hypothetical protein
VARGWQVKRAVVASDAPLVRCLSDIKHCDGAAWKAAQRAGGIRRLVGMESATIKEADVSGRRRYKTCALVGNAGSILNHKLGRYIDNHEVVVRFNVMGVDGCVCQSPRMESRAPHHVYAHHRSIRNSRLPRGHHMVPHGVAIRAPETRRRSATSCAGCFEHYAVKPSALSCALYSLLHVVLYSSW